jgi:hypothetical protein
MIAIASIVFLSVVASIAIDEGDVVHLITLDDEAGEQEADLWIVDLDGVLFLRANQPDVRWLERLRANPRVRLERGDVVSAYRAVPLSDEETRNRVHRAMSEKYGFADVTWNWMTNRADSVAIRLDPENREEDRP